MTVDSTPATRVERLLIPRPGGVAPPMEGYLVIPQAESPAPGIIVIHELWGLDDQIRRLTDRFAREGYVALAINLFSGRNRAACLWQIFNDLVIRRLEPRRTGVLAEIRRAIDILQDRPEVDRARIGVAGFCLGGGYALQLACVDDIQAASVFYGTMPQPISALARACPVVGSFPALDATATSGKRLEVALTRTGVPHDVKIYPNTVHGFFNENLPTYNRAAAEDAWARTLAFFREHLGLHHLDSA